MDERDAAELIDTAVGGHGNSWADIGAGSGTFTRALRSLLPRDSRIYAIDRDKDVIATLRGIGSGVIPVEADFTAPFALPGNPSLDGMLLANALHFVPNPGDVLGRLAGFVRPGGRVVIVEYDRRAANPWVPYPIRSERWPAVSAAAGLTNPSITARVPSRYAGELYVGVATTPGPAAAS
ncbi:MAG TPA: methyltransferase domain-containing protein [Gemmatimonadaceae bacterium]|nr:methyltransferase domain-containing protein [Gemmatimonadaceae bacterium]